MCVVVAERKKLLVALLQRLQPRQSFVDRDLRHTATFVGALGVSDHDAIIARAFGLPPD